MVFSFQKDSACTAVNGCLLTEARCKRVEFHTSSPEPLLHCSGLQIIMTASCFVHFFIINYLHFVLQAKFGMPKVGQDGSIFWRSQP